MDRLISQSGLPLQLNPASLPFFLAAALSAWLVVLAWARRNEPAAPPLISLLLFEGLWALCEAIEAVLLDPSAQAMMYRLKLSSVALVPPSLLFFVLEYTSRTGAAPPRFKVLILAVPAITISLIATSDEHRLFLTGMERVEIGGYRLLSPRYGPAFWIHTSYCYALLCLSAWLLARSALALGGVLRKQMLFLSACLLIPLAINVADVLGIIPLPYREYDITAATFVVTGVLGLVLLRRFHLLNIAPVSYSLVMQEMLDAIIVLDAWGRIAGVNRAALRLMGHLEKEIVGRPSDVIPGWLRIPEHLARLEGASELSYRLVADSRDAGSTYDVRVSRFPHGREPGWLVIIRDISAQSGAEAERTARIAAEQANRAKDAFLAKLSHELRTPLTPVLAITSAALDQRSIPPELRSSLEIVLRNVRHEASLIDDLLDQSLITLGKLRLRTELVDAHGLLHQSLEDCRVRPGCPGGRPPRFLGDDQPDRCRSGPTPAGLPEPHHQRREVLARSQSPHDPHAEHRGRCPRDRIPGRRSRPRGVAVEGDLRALHPGYSPRMPNEVRAWALACRSAGRSWKPTGAPSSRRVRGPGEGPLSGSSSAPRTSPRSRRSIDRRRAARSPREPAAEEPERARKSRRPTTILLVEDNPDSLRALAMSLSLLGYEVRTANSLRTALAAAEESRI